MAVAAVTNSSHRRSEDASISSAPQPEFARPTPPRRDTEQILDYYQSEDAGRIYIASNHYQASYPSWPSREREAPTGARSAMRPRSAGKDTNVTSTGRISIESVASSSSSVRRRTSHRSGGDTDKRRLEATEVQMRHESGVSTSREQRLATPDPRTQIPTDQNLFTRRGVDGARLGGLTLVGPPDVQPPQYVSSPIPTSAPATGVMPPKSQASRADPSPSGHHRSMSDAQSRRHGGTKTSPRDVGIVGTLGSMFSVSAEQQELPSSQRRPSTSDGDSGSRRPRSGALTAPVFQTPKSRSPSPLPLTGDPRSPHDTASELPLMATGWAMGQEGDTRQASTGLGLTLGQPVIQRSPHFIPSSLPTSDPPKSVSHQYMDRGISSRLPFKPNQPTLSYLHYQPGVHSTAGPLPSPPRHILTHPTSLPPPRPPRLLSPPPIRRNEMDHAKSLDKASHLEATQTLPIDSLRSFIPVSRTNSDFTIAAVSASPSGSETRLSELSSKPLDESSTSPCDRELPQPDEPAVSSRNRSHVREGAFPASSVFLSHPSQPSASQPQHRIIEELVASMGESPDQSPSSSSSAPTAASQEPPLLRHSEDRPNFKREDSWVSLSAESFGGGPDETSPPSSYPSSGEGSTQVATTNIVSDDGLVSRRRASLPAPPSEPHRRLHSLPRTPSLLSMSRSNQSISQNSPPLHRKAPSSWPDAMNFHDILVKKTAADRALAYAAKFRELSLEETGLREWLLLSVRKERREGPPPSAFPAAAATSRTFGKQPRHISRGSMASEITFPTRPDSYTATDLLSPRLTTDLASPVSPLPSLPYPSLAHGAGVRKRSSRTLAVESTLASPQGSTRTLGGGFFASIGRKASIKKERPFPPPSPTKLLSSRQTTHPPQPRLVKLGTTPTLPGGPRAPARLAQRTKSIAFTSQEQTRPDGQTPIRATEESTAVFDLQVQKLLDLLPHADKDTLAGYLRRANNQDPMSAIGTYLEDEKQGCLRQG